MSNASLRFEAQKKSPWAAAFMNIIPSAGYFYCGRWVLGLIVIFLTLFMALLEAMSGDEGLFSEGFILFLVAVLMIHGFISAANYNKQLLQEILAEEKQS